MRITQSTKSIIDGRFYFIVAVVLINLGIYTSDWNAAYAGIAFLAISEFISEIRKLCLAISSSNN
jgi:hypothetical protein